MNLTKQSVISLKGLLWGSEIMYIKCLTQKRSQYLIDIIINLIVILLCRDRCYKDPGDKEMKRIKLYTLLQQTDRSIAYDVRQNEVSTLGVEPEEWEVLQMGYVRPLEGDMCESSLNDMRKGLVQNKQSRQQDQMKRYKYPWKIWTTVDNLRGRRRT